MAAVEAAVVLRRFIFFLATITETTKRAHLIDGARYCLVNVSPSMGLPSEARAWLEATFADCVAYQMKLGEHEAAPTVAIVDLMQWIKWVPDVENTVQRAVQYFVTQVRHIMQRKGSTIKTCIVLVDGAALPVKRLVAHAKRYSGVEVLPSAGAPYLNRDETALRPTPWLRFAANQELLRRELYPRLYNAFLSCRYFTPWVGQNLILSGFPGRSHYETLYVERPWESFTNGGGQVWQVRYWDEQRELPIRERDERDDPALYHRAYMVQNVCPCAAYPEGGLVRAEWEEGKCTLSEADVRMFWFDHFFSTQHIVFYCNDGDVFSVGGLYARERLLAAPSTRVVGDADETQKRGTYHFRNRHTVCLPNKATKGPKAALGPLQYVNLNTFYELVCEYSEFRRAGVANPMATLVFMLVLAESDFVPNFLYGMGTQKVVWKTFMDNLPMFTHLVQINDLAGEGHTRRARSIIMDEKLFKTFVRYCYLSKVTSSAAFKKGAVRKLSYADLKSRTNNGDDDNKKKMPEPNEIRLRCRQIEYNLTLWRNGPMGFEPDPFQTWFGLPYFPYARDPETGAPKLVEAVSPRDRCADEAFACNLYRVRVEGKQLYRE